MKTKLLLSTALSFIISVGAFSQRSSGPSADVTQVGDIIPDGLVVIHCTSPKSAEDASGSLLVTMDETVASMVTYSIYKKDEALRDDDISLGLDAGEYRLALESDGRQILNEVFELTAGIQNYSVHFHDIGLELPSQKKSTSPTGISEREEVTTFTIYPNPTEDMLHIDGLPTSILDITILDEQGREVMVERKERETATFDTSMRLLENGIYTIHIKTADGAEVGVERVVVER